MVSTQNRERQKIWTSLLALRKQTAKLYFVRSPNHGAPLSGLGPGDFMDGSTFHIGQPPARIDLLQRIDGIAFDEAWKNRLEGFIEEDIPVMVISRKDLIRNKVASGREQDVLDAKKLQAAE
ncbi:MAG TPA: hypothetical protein VJS37_10655 [Terriglobales bacterium]|nr:hypothetical protein [Terriglobales bacterium]